ncbi:hypothetical protein HY573_01585 [Candidatus Parcubacteria bacterium]|nr:hypothetical protein [Candidatus Parcubacteria bacterium]
MAFRFHAALTGIATLAVLFSALPFSVSAAETCTNLPSDTRYRVCLQTSVSGSGQSWGISANAVVQFNFENIGSPSSWCTGSINFYMTQPPQGWFGSGSVDSASYGPTFLSPDNYTIQTTWSATCLGQSMSTSNFDSFTVNPPPPPAPSAPTVSPNPSPYNQTITFSWGAASGATYYVVETDSGTCQFGNCFPGNVTSMTSSGYSVGSHWVQARACNASGCSAYSAPTTFTVNPQPPTISLSADKTIITSGEPVTFTLTIVSGTATSCTAKSPSGDGYLNNVSVSPTGGSGTINPTVSGTQSAQCSNAGGASNEPNVAIKVVPNAPNTPVVNPSTSRHGDTATASWSPSASGVPATSYAFYSNNNVGSSCAAGCPIAGTQVGPAPNHGLYTAGTFFIYVTACNADGCGPPSLSTSFTIQSNEAAFVSEKVKNRTIPPDQPAVNVGPNTTFRAEITFRNTGTATWDNVGEYVLRSQNPAGNTTWGISETIATSPPVSSVPPNGTVTFAGDLPAPATAGTYNFQWQMYRKTNAFGYFGVPSTNVAITVPGPAVANPIQVRLQIKAKQKLPLQ